MPGPLHQGIPGGMSEMSRRRSVLYSGLETPRGTGQGMVGKMVEAIVVFAIAAIILFAVGPVIDYFALYLATMPADAAPYANTGLALFPWVYRFIILMVLMPIVYVVLRAIGVISYSQYGD